jgi:hypothetical protein
MQESEALAKWRTMLPKQQLTASRKHYNGTCVCYCERGKVIPGSIESGRSCVACSLPQPSWGMARRAIGV